MRPHFSIHIDDRSKATYHILSGILLPLAWGIQHITKNRRYIGKHGYDRIHSKALTLKSLKEMNRAGYALIKNRLRYFPFVHQLLQNGELFRFYKERVLGSRIQASFLLHTKKNDLYLHLFLAKESPSSNTYAPMSYIVTTNRDDNPTLYISKQEHKKIAALDILFMK